MVTGGNLRQTISTLSTPHGTIAPPRRIHKHIKLMTWNIHNGVGGDRRYDLRRIEEVIRSEDPDIIALQEVDSGLPRSHFDDQSRLLAEGLEMEFFYCETLPANGGGGFGNTVLSRFPLLRRQRYDISHPAGREPRYCARVDLEIGDGAALHVFNCHLGLATRERRWQQRQMLSDAILLSRDIEHPVVLMGDFNDRPFQVVHQRMRQYFKDAFRASGRRFGATFKLGWIRWRLDHIYISPELHVRDSWVRRTPPAHIASDHRPLLAEIEVEWRG